jgi:hypothetical protein
VNDFASHSSSRFAERTSNSRPFVTTRAVDRLPVGMKALQQQLGQLLEVRGVGAHLVPIDAQIGHHGHDVICEDRRSQAAPHSEPTGRIRGQAFTDLIGQHPVFPPDAGRLGCS